MLCDGCQAWEIAAHLRKKEKSVRDMLQNDKQFASQLKAKRGRWSALEEAHLRRLIGRNSRYIPNKVLIAEALGRTTGSVTAKINKILTKAKPPDMTDGASRKGGHGNAERTILKKRLSHILDGLMKMRKTEEWDQVLREKSQAEWAAAILDHIPEPVQHMLSSSSPPTGSDLRSLDWQNTKDFGVYICVLEPSQNPLRPEPFIYIGSATGHGQGLAGRKAGQQRRRDSAIGVKSRKYSLCRNTAHFATLFSIQVCNDEDMLRAQYLTTLSEAVLTVWLAALSTKGRSDRWTQLQFRSLCCWDYTKVPYRGLCSHNPLTMNIEHSDGRLKKQRRARK